MRRPAALLVVLSWLSAAVASADPVENAAPPRPWRELILPREEISAESNALVRWRPLWPRLFPEDSGIQDQLQRRSSPLEGPSANDDPALRAWLGSIAPTLSRLVMHEGEALQPAPMRGPETSFPDHQPLRQLATVRTAAMKAAWTGQRHDEALVLALDNLALARALLSTQEGLIPLLNASGIWQLSLDGIYWLTRQPDLTPPQAERLQTALLSDERLAAVALIRAFRGEFTFFTRVVLERLPPTDDVELLLSSIGSLGMAPAAPPPDDEPRLSAVARPPLDREATLQAAADEVSAWVDAFTASNRHPRAPSPTHAAPGLRRYAREIPELLRYAVQTEPATVGQVALVDAEIAAVENPVGKLFLVITTSQWEPLSVSVFRREAQRGALTALLAWRRFGRPAPFEKLVAEGVLPAAPADPFSAKTLIADADTARIWSVGENGDDDGGAGDGENIGRPTDLVWPAAPILATEVR